MTGGRMAKAKVKEKPVKKAAAKEMAPQVVDDVDGLKRLVALAKRLKAAETDLEAAELAVKVRKAALLEVSDSLIPTLMEELGVEVVALTGGDVLSVKKDVSASIPAERRPEAHQWLRDAGHGDLVTASRASSMARSTGLKRI